MHMYYQVLEYIYFKLYTSKHKYFGDKYDYLGFSNH